RPPRARARSNHTHDQERVPMRRYHFASCSLCLAIAAAAGAQQGIAPVAVTEPLAPAEANARPARAAVAGVHGEEDNSNLLDAAKHSAAIIDAVLVNKLTTTPPGMKVLVTEYTFQVYETLKGQVPTTMVVRETGGLNLDGSGMCTIDSHKLTLGGRY